MPDFIEFSAPDLSAIGDELATLPKRLDLDIQRRALRSGGAVIIREAKRLAPVKETPYRGKRAAQGRRPGDLKRSIAQRAVRGQAMVQLGYKQPHSRRGHLSEFGTRQSRAIPHFRPALDGKAGQAFQQIAKRLKVDVAKVAAELRGPFRQISKRTKRLIS